MSYAPELAFTPEEISNPYPWYRRLRESAPVHWDTLRGNWLVSRYEDVAALLRDDERLTAEQNGLSNSMLISDPPRHTRLRSLVSRAFTPRTVRRLEPRIHEIVDELLDAVADSPEFDAVGQFGYPLPITVIAELLGVDKAQWAFFHEASAAIALATGPSGEPGTRDRARAGRARLVEYFNGLIAERRAAPQEDLISELIALETQGDKLSPQELMGMLIILIIGGHETTANLIGNGLNALLRHPEHLDLLRNGDVGETAVEELLRYDSPVQYTGRKARVDFQLHGKPIKAGDGVRMLLASGNRDESTFNEPDLLDLTRHPCAHLSFGGGIHYCLGAELARLEGRIALETIVRRFPNMRLSDPDEVRYRPAPVLRGLEELRVTI